jgi:hypothetical protein
MEAQTACLRVWQCSTAGQWHVPWWQNLQEKLGVEAICLHDATLFQPSTPVAMLCLMTVWIYA